MTTFNKVTANDNATTTPDAVDSYRFPDPPDRELEYMASFDHLAATGSVYHLIEHFGDRSATVVAGEHYLAPLPDSDLSGLMVPDLMIAFNVDPAGYRARNAYVISEHGKPPDFVLEIASPSTGRNDVGFKRDGYAALGIPEYWRFDETGEHHGARLAGDRLVNGRYEPIAVEQLDDAVWQGHSDVLNLDLRWDNGQLAWHNPATGNRIATLADERVRAEEERARTEQERARTEQERARAEQAEARNRELEEQLRQLRNS